MAVKYNLRENSLASAKSYTARPHDVPSYDLDGIIGRMLEQGSTVTRADIVAVLTSFFQTVGTLTAEGYVINTKLFRTNFSISGTFEGVQDVFDKSRHTLRLNINTGEVFKDALAKVQLGKTPYPESIPQILEVIDNASKSLNDEVTSGGILEIKGNHIKVEGDNADNGVYFVTMDGTKHKAISIVENKPSRLFAVLPTLSPGKYILQITTQYNKGNVLHDIPKTGIFDQFLKVS